MILSILSFLLFNLSINKDSGIYEKGERAVVSCHTDIVPTDSLFVSVSYNNKVGQEFRILPTSTDFTVLEQGHLPVSVMSWLQKVSVPVMKSQPT